MCIGELRELGILADRDEDGYLLQIVAQPAWHRSCSSSGRHGTSKPDAESRRRLPA